ncbi:hypothetical protein PQX77_002741, partial [Marasmius sp. AFHP31]
MTLENNQTGGTQNNYNATDQNINYGRDQAVGGNVVNIGRDFVKQFTTTVSNPYKSLWDALAGIGASHNAEQQFSRGDCLEGTREEALRIIREWMAAKGHHFPICWLSGAAGVGKSAIAMTVAKACEEEDLVTSFFFFRSDPKRNNPGALILSIAHGLVSTVSFMKRPIQQKISKDPKILEAKLEDQFRELILKPTLKQ